MRNAETVLGIIQERSHEEIQQLKAGIHGIGSLESYVTWKRSRVVRRGVIGKVPAKATRW
jgi:hypothetical protein